MRSPLLISSTHHWPSFVGNLARLGISLCLTVIFPAHTIAAQDGAPGASFAPRAARSLQVGPSGGLAADSSGSFYLASSISSRKPIDFDNHRVQSTGDADLFVTKLDAKGHALWATGYGDAEGNPQVGVGAAVTKDGTLAVVGNFTGSMTFGGNTIKSANQADFLAGIRASNGKGKWAKRFDVGMNGHLSVVAANPMSGANRIAVCGRAVQAATDLVPKAEEHGGDDIVIGMFDSTGTLLWSAQIGDAGNEQCDALAIDDRGDLYAAGRFDSAKLSFGSLPALIGPGNTNRKYLWVARFDGATGTPTQAAAFGGAVGQALPGGMAVDPSGKVVVVGQFTGSLPFGSSKMATAGGIDAFVAELDPAGALAPVWAVRLGGPGSDAANGVATTSAGEVLVTGFFSRTTTGAAALTAAGRGASDVFLLVLDGASGTTIHAYSYGDDAMQSGDAIAVNRLGGDQIALAGTLNGSMGFPAPAGTIKTGGGPETFFVTGKIEHKGTK